MAHSGIRILILVGAVSSLAGYVEAIVAGPVLFIDLPYNGYIEANATNGSTVWRVKHNDPLQRNVPLVVDSNVTSDLKIFTLVQNDDKVLLQLDIKGGSVTLAKSGPASASDKSIYYTVIAARRPVVGISEHAVNTTLITLTVVKNLNADAPTFNESTYDVSVPYDASVGYSVATVYATDSQTNGVTYQVESGNDGNVFRLNSASGRLELNTKLSSSIIMYSLKIKAFDKGIPVKSSTVTVTISVLFPTTASPTTVATTQAVTTAIPTTQAATTLAPTTKSVTTAPPTTETATTQAPTTTSSPTTQAATTLARTTQPVTTLSPSTQTATTLAATTKTATTSAPSTQATTTLSTTSQAATTLAPTTLASTTRTATTTATTLASTTNTATTSAPTTLSPTTQAATTEAVTTQAPTTQAPTTVASTTNVATTSAPTTQVATTSASTTETATTSILTTQAATTSAPTTETATTSIPTTQAATTLSPTTQEATTLVLTTEAATTTTPSPTTQAATTLASTTLMSTTKLATTSAPTTEAGTTPISTTQAATTLSSTTLSSTTQVATTVSSTTQATTTLASTTQAATTLASTTQATTSSAASETATTSNPTTEEATTSSAPTTKAAMTSTTPSWPSTNETTQVVVTSATRTATASSSTSEIATTSTSKLEAANTSSPNISITLQPLTTSSPPTENLTIATPQPRPKPTHGGVIIVNPTDKISRRPTDATTAVPSVTDSGSQSASSSLPTWALVLIPVNLVIVIMGFAVLVCLKCRKWRKAEQRKPRTARKPNSFLDGWLSTQLDYVNSKRSKDSSVAEDYRNHTPFFGEAWELHEHMRREKDIELGNNVSTAATAAAHARQSSTKSTKSQSSRHGSRKKSSKRKDRSTRNDDDDEMEFVEEWSSVSRAQEEPLDISAISAAPLLPRPDRLDWKTNPLQAQGVDNPGMLYEPEIPPAPPVFAPEYSSSPVQPAQQQSSRLSDAWQEFEYRPTLTKIVEEPDEDRGSEKVARPLSFVSGTAAERRNNRARKQRTGNTDYLEDYESSTDEVSDVGEFQENPLYDDRRLNRSLSLPQSRMAPSSFSYGAQAPGRVPIRSHSLRNTTQLSREESERLSLRQALDAWHIGQEADCSHL
ncbi:uncharacterized protein [Oscarella lobularis]|uniref:uncharacterized protein n=1 Tax=Oscarella lobularis TaxID=121494 RepID=UPI00331317BE